MARIRARRPLVHCLTSAVSANLTANALICLGASPIMADAHTEVGYVKADALLVNLGMLNLDRVSAMRRAIALMRETNKPWVLDPVAAGSLVTRTATAWDFSSQQPALIKGNASEILAMAGADAEGQGVDARHAPTDALAAAGQLAREKGCVVAVTGPVDHVADGEHTVPVPGGDPLMARVSGLGCVAGAVAAACLAVRRDDMLASCHALEIMAQAGERASAGSMGPGSFVPAFLDALAAM